MKKYTRSETIEAAKVLGTTPRGSVILEGGTKKNPTMVTCSDDFFAKYGRPIAGDYLVKVKRGYELMKADFFKNSKFKAGK